MGDRTKIIATNPDDNVRRIVEDLDREGMDIDFIEIEKLGEPSAVFVETRCLSTVVKIDISDESIRKAMEQVKCPVVQGENND